MNLNPPGERLRVLEAFRGIAILAVLACHYFSTWQRPVNLYLYDHDHRALAPLGGLGVEFFFMISGFVILLTLERCEHLPDFWLRRVARLYPALIACVLLTWGITAVLGPAPMRRGPLDALASLTMLGPHLRNARWMDGVYWSLQVELVFYFWIGVLYLAGRTRIATAWSAFSLIALACWLAGTRLDSPLLRSIADSVLLARFALFFSVGRFFYQLCRSHLLSLLLAVTAIVVYVSIWRQQEAAVHASFLLMVLGFGLFIRGWLAWIAVAPLVFVGDISYSLYLIHGNLGVGVIRLLKGTAHLPDFLAAGIATGISIATAWLLVRWVERPARRAVIRWGFERLARGRGRLAPLAFGRPE